MPASRTRSFLLTILLAAAAAPTARAAPRDELLRFVPDDVGFCLVVQDLRKHSGDVFASPFAQAFAKSPLAAKLAAAAEWKQLSDVEKYLKEHLGVGWKEVREDLLGDAFVFAYRPGPPDKPEQEQGAFLLRARDAKVLATFVRKLNALQKHSGELKELVEREHRGAKYVRRVEKGGTSCYLLRGEVLVYTAQEAFLHKLIESDQALKKGAEPPLTARLKGLALEKAFAALLVRPRAFDAAVSAKDDPGSKTVAKCWKALTDVGLGLALGGEIEISLAVKGKVDQLPASIGKLAKSMAKRSDLWAAFPEDALFAAAGRVDAAALYEAWGELMPKASKEAADAELQRTFGSMLGKDFVKEVLPALGPDVGLYVTAPPGGGKEWAPRALAAVRVARGGEDDPTDEAVFSGVESWAQLYVLAHNKQNPERTLSLKTTRIKKSKARYLDGEGVFPAGVQPAFALRGGYLVLATSLAELRRFDPPSPSRTSGPVPLARSSVKAVRAYLKERRDPLAEALAARLKTSKEKAAERIDEWRANLELIDRVELRQQTDGDRLTLTLALRPAKPLKK
jgi:hypothetical protein